MIEFNIEFYAEQQFDVEFAEGSRFDCQFGQITQVHTASQYTGAYDVTPKMYCETQLSTKDKLMAKNVTIRKIPRYEVSNESGGNTLIIGDEYYGQ